VRQIFRLMLPRGLDQGVDQINYTVETIIGSALSKGSITALTLANNLKNVPLALIASSITTATFPDLASKAANGDRGELVKSYVNTARLILFLAIPAAVFTVMMRGYLVRLLYGFSDADTYNALGWYAGVIVFYSLFLLVSRVFYALQNTKTPLLTSLLSVPVNIGLSLILSHHYGVAGLSMAASVASALETTLLIFVLRRRYGRFGENQILKAGSAMLLAGLLMAGALYLAIHYVWPILVVDRGFAVLAPKFAALSLLAAVTYLAPCYLLRIKEAKAIWAKLRDIMARSTNLT